VILGLGLIGTSKFLDIGIDLDNVEEACLRLDGKFKEQNARLLDSICIFLQNMKHGVGIQKNKELQIEAFLYVDFHKNNTRSRERFLAKI
jgi:hypothetical protein